MGVSDRNEECRAPRSVRMDELAHHHVPALAVGLGKHPRGLIPVRVARVSQPFRDTAPARARPAWPVETPGPAGGGVMNEPLRPWVYPLTLNPVVDDDRFTLGLHLDVAAVLAEHGYRPLGSLDIADLGQALYRFLYVGTAR